MKLDNFIKRKIMQNLNELSIFDLKFIMENYSFIIADKFLKMIYRINRSRGIILADKYPTYTKFSSVSKYTNFDLYHLERSGIYSRFMN